MSVNENTIVTCDADDGNVILHIQRNTSPKLLMKMAEALARAAVTSRDSQCVAARQAPVLELVS